MEEVKKLVDERVALEGKSKDLDVAYKQNIQQIKLFESANDSIAKQHNEVKSRIIIVNQNLDQLLTRLDKGKGEEAEK